MNLLSLFFFLEHLDYYFTGYVGADENPDQAIAEGIIFITYHVRVEQTEDQPQNSNNNQSSEHNFPYLALSFFSSW